MTKILIALNFLMVSISSIAVAAITSGNQLTNKEKKSIQMTILGVNKNGVPTSIRFSKDQKKIVIAKVNSSSESKDTSAGEVFDVTGPWSEGDACNFSAKLTLVGDEIKIDIEQADVGRDFFKYCGTFSQLAGVYKK